MKRLPAPAARQTLDGTLWVTAAQALMVPTGLATVAYLTRTLGPEGYGHYAVVLTLITWIEFSIAALFSRATVKFVAEAEDWRPVATAVMRLGLLVAVGTTFGLWAGSGLLAQALGAEEMAGYVRLAALDIPVFVAGQAHLQILVGLGRFRQRALAGALRWLTRLVLIVFLVQGGWSVHGAIGGCLGASLLELLICRLFCQPPWLGRAAFPLRRLWGYAVPLFLSAMSLRMLDGLDLLALKLLGGTAEQAGLYAAALNLALLPALVATALGPILLATLSRLLQRGEESQAKQLSREALRGILLLLPLAALVAGSGTEITRLFFGPDFTAAGPLLGVLIVAGTGRLMISVAEAILTAFGKPGWTVRVCGPLVPLTAAGQVLLIPWLGPPGAAGMTATASGLGALVSAVGLFRQQRTAPPPGTLVRAAILSGLAYAAASAWPTPGFGLLIKLPALAAGIALAFILCGEFGAWEWMRSRSRVRGRRLQLGSAGELQ